MSMPVIIAAGLLLLVPIISFIIIIDIKTLVYITLLAVFFPIHIQLMGRDAFTTGTVCIFILFIKYCIVSIFEKKLIKEKYDYWVYILIVLGVFSILIPYYTGVLVNDQLGPAMRLFFTFISSLLLFLVIKNLPQVKFQSHVEPDHLWLEKLLNIIILLIAIHIMISICVKFFPSTGSFFNIFLTRNTEVFDSVKRGTMGRIGSFVFGMESYGEVLATLSPIIIYKIYKHKNPIWFFYLFVFSLGLLFTVTRSGILLFISGIMISTFYMANNKRSKTFVLFYLMLSSIVLLITINPPVLNSIFIRFSAATETYHSDGSIFEILNRDFLPEVWALVISKISLFGNGATEYNFHNLFLTTLHRRGLAGAFFFFAVLLYPTFCLIKSFNEKSNKINKNLVFLCLLSMGLFLANELKFEFTRGGSYQQLCWCLFAVFYLASKKSENSEKYNYDP